MIATAPVGATTAIPPASVHATVGLGGDPFPRDPLAGAWIALPVHEAIATRVITWLADPDPGAHGLAIVSAAAGAGKSRLLGQLVVTLAADDERLIGVLPGGEGKRSDAQLLRAAVEAFGGTPSGRTGLELTTELRALLAGHERDALPPVLLIDDAALTGSQLEIVRGVLGTAPAGTPAPLRIVLVGPPELPDRVSRRRGLAAVTRLDLTLPPLDVASLGALLNGRVDRVRIAPATAPFFDGAAVAAIHAASGGNPGAAIALAREAVRAAIATGRQGVDARLAGEVVEAGSRDAVKATDDAVVQTRLSLPGLEETAGEAPPSRRRGRQQ